MEEIYDDAHYKSGWRLLARDDGLVTESTYSAVETSRKKEKRPEKLPESAGKPDEAAEAPVQNEILKKLSELCEDIDTLSHRVQEQNENIVLLSNRLQNQEEKTETLVKVLEEKGLQIKKSAFGLSWK